MPVLFSEVILGTEKVPVSGSYEFTGTGEIYKYVLDSDGNTITCNLSYPFLVFISGILRPSSWFTIANDTTGTKVLLTGNRVFPIGAICTFVYFA